MVAWWWFAISECFQVILQVKHGCLISFVMKINPSRDKSVTKGVFRDDYNFMTLEAGAVNP